MLAPTGTIGLMMDCDTTGIEPDLALVKFKKLVGGGSMQIVNQTVPQALRSLGYQEESIEAIVEFIAENGHVIDAPGLKREHYEVFDCAMGARSIAPMGHVRMMAAVQPFISGAISKTVNMPENASVADVAEIYQQGWKMGLKALAIYRDNCKVGQPLSASNKNHGEKSADASANVVEAVAAAPVVTGPVRRRLPKKRPSQTVSFTVGGAEGYLTTGSYPDDGLGEVFIKLGKQGSTLAGVMDAFSIAVSVGLQYGIPLESYVAKFTNLRFEPAGMTDDPDVRIATSVMDYLFRRIALDYLPVDARAELGIFSAEERTAQVSASYGGDTARTQRMSSRTCARRSTPRRWSGRRWRPAGLRRPALGEVEEAGRARAPAAPVRPPSCWSWSSASPPTHRCASPAGPRCGRPVPATSARAAAPPPAAADLDCGAAPARPSAQDRARARRSSGPAAGTGIGGVRVAHRPDWHRARRDDTIECMGKVFEEIDDKLAALDLPAAHVLCRHRTGRRGGQHQCLAEGHGRDIRRARPAAGWLPGLHRVRHRDHRPPAGERPDRADVLRVRGPPKIVRLHGTGRVVLADDPEFAELRAAFGKDREVGQRSIIVADLNRISDSCGYSVAADGLPRGPGHPRQGAVTAGRRLLPASTGGEHNADSIDGLPGIPALS